MVCEDTLRVKNLPNELSDAEKEDLLRHFGATSVKVITSKSKQRSVAYAKFEAKEIAKAVMLRLHQMAVLNSRLCVEFAEHDLGQSKPKCAIEGVGSSSSKHFKVFVNKLNSWNSSSFYQPPPAHLKYSYPKPNRATINNIAHALASVPKFYTQVLHLMNKMNLPPPFSNIPDPPNTSLRQPVPPQHKPNEQAAEHPSSESEIESDPDEANKNKEIIPAKRKLAQKKAVKRPKFIKPNAAIPNPSARNPEKAADVFEKVDVQTPRKIELKLPTEMLDSAAILENSLQKNEDVEEEKDVISEEELISNRIDVKDLRILPVFKDYHPGLPNCKLYLKNIAKTVEVKDLEYVYKRYKTESGSDHFEIRLMKEGRMKGQAFITLESMELAQKAVKETNGFVLNEKPLVVVFANPKK